MNKKRALSLILTLMLTLGLVAGCGSKNASTGGSAPAAKSASASEAADTILKSSVIYTVASRDPVDGGIAIKDGKILAVGSDEDMEQYTGDDTEVVDYGDQMMMPGFVDAHTHSWIEPAVVGVDVTFIPSQEDATKICKEYLEEHPDTDFLVGGGWYAAAWGGDDPVKEYLDEVSTDIPISLVDFDHHNRWVNSKALEMAGIDAAKAKEINDKAGKKDIMVDENGEPTGYIQERGTDLIIAIEPEYTIDEAATCINVWSTYGVTAVNDMNPFLGIDDSFYEHLGQLRDQGKLQVRHNLCLPASSSEKDIETWIERWNSEEDDMIKFGSLKVLVDGVASTHQASMLQPYADDPSTSGPPIYFSVEELEDVIKKADKYGLASHFHVCGDAAVRQAVDAYEKAQEDGVKLDPGFSIEHCDTTNKDDVKRIGALGISTNLTPDFMNVAPENWDDNVYLQVLDSETAKELWPCKCLIDAGANVGFGTDTYCSSYNPFVQLYRAVYRVGDDGNPEGGYLPEEKIDIKQAIECYTLNSAKSARWADKIGTLEAGKLADIIVLDTNILECGQEELYNAKVEKTYLGGNLIYELE